MSRQSNDRRVIDTVKTSRGSDGPQPLLSSSRGLAGKHVPLGEAAAPEPFRLETARAARL